MRHCRIVDVERSPVNGGTGTEWYKMSSLLSPSSGASSLSFPTHQILMSRSFFAIVLFSFMALAQAAPLVKDVVDEVIRVPIIVPEAGTQWPVDSIQVVEWCAVPLHAPLVTVPSGFLRLTASPLSCPCRDLPTVPYDTSATADIFLGYVNDSSDDEHLYLGESLPPFPP